MENNLFASIYGYENIKLELKRILDQLLQPEKYAVLGVSEPHGVLLHGVPGVGKSTLAKQFLEATGRNTFICRKDKPNGEFVKDIVRIFDEAANSAPSVILLDDLDKFANEDERHRDTEEFVTVQACIDRVREKQVFVIATANNIKKLPESLVRAGRFDSVIELKYPRGKDAEEIVAYYLKQKSFIGNVDVQLIARLLDGKSCAELEAVINMAGAYAGFEGRTQVEMRDVIKAILRVIFKAPETQNPSERAAELTAYHEAGHALVATLLEPNSVNLVTIEAHDSYASGVTSVYRNDDYFYSKKLMENRVMCLLAGKAATEICFGEVDTGSNSDLCRAFDLVHRFVDHYCSYGFKQFIYAKESSDGILKRRDLLVAKDIKHYYKMVKKLLEENREKLEELACVLLKEKTILGDRVLQIVNAA